MWVRMSLSLWTVHGLLWPGDSRWNGDTGRDSEGDSSSDTAWLLLSQLVLRY